VLVGLQLALGAWLVFSNVSGSIEARARFGPSAPKPPLYGIWDVTAISIDGEARPLLLTDPGLWRRLVISNASVVSFQGMDDTFTPYRATIDGSSRTITLTTAPPPGVPGARPGSDAGRLTFEQPEPTRIILDGTLRGRSIRAELQRLDHTDFELLRSRFRWVQDYPFNR
jgi:hypothetical protein